MTWPSIAKLNVAVNALYDATTDPNALLLVEEIEAAIEAVERVRTKVILRERNQGKSQEGGS